MWNSDNILQNLKNKFSPQIVKLSFFDHMAYTGREHNFPPLIIPIATITICEEDKQITSIFGTGVNGPGKLGRGGDIVITKSLNSAAV